MDLNRSALQTAPEKRCFPFLTMVYSACSMETGTGILLFSIPDNGLLCLFYGNGDRHFAVCHRLDDTHAEIDGVNYSLPDFAKRMKHNQISFAPA